MDDIIVIANVIAVAHLTSKIIEYLNDVKDTPKECWQLKIEATNLYSLIIRLQCNLEQGDASDPWCTLVRAMAGQNGPMEQYYKALKQLESKIRIEYSSQKLKRVLLWKFTKTEVVDILGKLEHFKSLINVALDMDHMWVLHADKASICS